MAVAILYITLIFQQFKMTKKKCNKCDSEKELSEFPKGRGACCRVCKNAYKRSRLPFRKEYFKDYNKKYYKKNKDDIKIKTKLYLEKNREDVSRKNSEREKKNRPIRNEQNRNRYKNDEDYKFSRKLRAFIRRCFVNDVKSDISVKLLGCDFVFFKKYIASKFKDGMSWDNYAKDTWNLDHITAFCAFDFSDPLQQRVCCHYLNLRPYWANDNFKKNKYSSIDELDKLLIELMLLDFFESFNQMSEVRAKIIKRGEQKLAFKKHNDDTKTANSAERREAQTV